MLEHMLDVLGSTGEAQNQPPKGGWLQKDVWTQGRKASEAKSREEKGKE